MQIKILTRYLISALVSLSLMLPSSNRPLQGMQSPGLWSDVPAVCLESGVTGDWSHEERLVPAGGSAVLLLPPPVDALPFLSCGKKALLPDILAATDISHCGAALNFSAA